MNHDQTTDLRQWPISPDNKGFGPLAARGPVTAASLARAGVGLHDGELSYPLMTLRESALSHNIAAMADYCRRAGVELAPHGKTMMAPQLAARQLAAGAWGITVATPAQLQVYYRYGVRRLLLANELVDAAGIQWLATTLGADPELEVYCYVDSVEGVRLLEKGLASADADPERTLPVLVELGHPGGRTGARGPEAAREVAAEAQRPLLSAGGSAFFDVVVAELTRTLPGEEQPPLVVLRSGAYITHDHGFYAGITPAGRDRQATATDSGDLTLQPALELWAPVLSRPEPGLALLGAGRRDVSFDEGLPVPLRVRDGAGNTQPAADMSVTALNDQHAYLQLPPSADLGPGDLVCLGISHPCTAFDKWRAIPVVDDDDRLTDVIHTFF
jgi:D-serine dehydratase